MTFNWPNKVWEPAYSDLETGEQWDKPKWYSRAVTSDDLKRRRDFEQMIADKRNEREPCNG